MQRIIHLWSSAKPLLSNLFINGITETFPRSGYLFRTDHAKDFEASPVPARFPLIAQRVISKNEWWVRGSTGNGAVTLGIAANSLFWPAFNGDQVLEGDIFTLRLPRIHGAAVYLEVARAQGRFTPTYTCSRTYTRTYRRSRLQHLGESNFNQLYG